MFPDRQYPWHSPYAEFVTLIKLHLSFQRIQGAHLFPKHFKGPLELFFQIQGCSRISRWCTNPHFNLSRRGLVLSISISTAYVQLTTSNPSHSVEFSLTKEDAVDFRLRFSRSVTSSLIAYFLNTTCANALIHCCTILCNTVPYSTVLHKARKVSSASSRHTTRLARLNRKADQT